LEYKQQRLGLAQLPNHLRTKAKDFSNASGQDIISKALSRQILITEELLPGINSSLSFLSPLCR
jgi:hypothetical protein